MTSPSHLIAAGSRSVRRQRGWLLIALVAGVAAFTGVMLVLGHALSDRFVAQVEAELAWRALRGARELAKTAELDPALIDEALGAHAASPDTQAIAVDVGDQIVASRGTIASVVPVFDAPPGTLVRGNGYVASWAEVARENQAAKIAIVVSTRRLSEARAMQAAIWQRTLIAGGAATVLGALVVLLLTRGVRVGASARGAATSTTLPAAGVGASGGDQATGLEDPLAERSRELAERTDELAERTGELAARQRDLALVLGSAAQGFVMFDLGGRVVGERSPAIDRWFGELAPGTALAGHLSPHAHELADQVSLGLASIAAGELPLALCLDQLPKRLATAAHTLDLAYAPLLQGGKPERILLIASDITEQVARERAAHEQREQREIVALSQLVTGDRAGFDEFFAESAGLVASLDAPGEPGMELRTLRTLKDACAYYGLETYVELCQEIEASLTTSGAPINDAQRVALANGWARVAARLVAMLA